MPPAPPTIERPPTQPSWPAPRIAPTREWSRNDWTLVLTDHRMILKDGEGLAASIDLRSSAPTLRRRWFRWHLNLEDGRRCRLRGMSRSDVSDVRLTVARLAIAAACAWTEFVDSIISTAIDQSRWIPREVVDQMRERRPSPSIVSSVNATPVGESLEPHEIAALVRLDDDLESRVADANETIMARELVERRNFFDTAERSPLTDEQARAVACFDNRVQVIASAGSGKTSVMVARAAYAVARGFVDPDRVLMLAFNRDAARELQSRVDRCFEALGIESSVRASTFHSFGLRTIGQATGAKPRLAPWVESGQDTAEVSRIVDELRDSSPEFRYRWDLYRLLFAGAPTQPDGGDKDAYDKARDTQGFRTFNGEVVRSHGELMIANWLFLNGVAYEYEKPYVHHVATAEYSQYQPDFYYPGADVWHEHWALDRDGRAPVSDEFAGYAEGIAWKRECHRTHGTTLVESTWGEIIDGSGFEALQTALEHHGVEFDWDPDRPIPGEEPIKHEDLVRFVRTFLAHVKSNCLTRQDLDERLASEMSGLGRYRARLFTDFFWHIYDEWEGRLRAGNLVDFEDMLVLAAQHLEARRVDPGYDLVMVDEFQDASTARARIIKGLLNKPGRFLLVVGDDWQSINRFAGSDMSVMTNFAAWFGSGPELRLETTFRCTQAICDVSQTFVTKNPRQLGKDVRSVHGGGGPPVRIHRVDQGSTGVALSRYLEELSCTLADEHPNPGGNRVVSVKVLGRYRFDADVMPRRTYLGLGVQFLTVHRSKGLEADYIVVPRMCSGRYGFPSGIADDPLLDLAMPVPDGYPHAEERRLFYVALTRARREVLLITEVGKESPFVQELVAEKLAIVDGVAEVEPCPRCQHGTMVQRTGRFGAFLGCSSYPRCSFTKPLPV